jgi:PDZ domain-containing protein
MVPGAAGLQRDPGAQSDLVFRSVVSCCISGGVITNMKKLVPVALAVLFLVGVSSAQSLPAIDVFGGYSYLSFNMPASADTISQQLGMQGWQVSASVAVFRHIAVEANFSDHKLSDCGGTTGLNCSSFAYLFGPRYNLGDRNKKLNGYLHALIGEDNATLPLSAIATSDTSTAFAGGGGVQYWVSRRIGVQGGGDYFYTHHLNVDGVTGQSNFMASAGVVFRFGQLPPPPPPAQPSPENPKPAKQHRSILHPLHKAPASTTPSAQPTTIAGAGVVNVPGKGIRITALGAIFAPEEFDGAKVVEVSPGGVAEMASLKPGDLIKSVDGKAVRTPMELAAELSDKTGKVRIGMQRGDFATETIILLGH